MAWQLRSHLLIALPLLTSVSFSLAAPICAKDWSPFPSGTQVINGRVLGFENAADSKSASIKEYDFNGKVLKEYKVPRRVNGLPYFTEVAEGVAYGSDNKTYHFDPKTNKEYEISIDSQVYGSCGSSMQKKTSVWKSCSSSEQGQAYDFKSHKKIDIPNPKYSATAGQTIAYGESAKNEPLSKIAIYDFASGKKQTFDVPPTNRIDFASKNQISVTDDSGKNSANFVNMNGKWTQVAEDKNRKLTGVLDDGRLLFGTFKHKSGKDVEITLENAKDFIFKTDVYDKTGKTKQRTLEGYYSRNQMGGGYYKMEFPQKFIAYTEKDFSQLASGKNVKPAFESKGYPLISNGEQYANIVDPETQKSTIVNLKTKKAIQLPGSGNLVSRESEDGKKVYINGQGNGGMILDIETGKMRKFLGSGYLHFDPKLEKWLVQKQQLMTTREVCLPDTVKVIEDDCNCMIKGAESENKPLPKESLGNIQDIALAALCQAPSYDEKAWDKITPSLSKGEISKSQARLYLKRFQRMEGYRQKQHEAILSGILKSDLVEKEPGLVLETLKTLSSTMPSEMTKLYRFFKLDKRIPKDVAFDESNVCKSEGEKYFDKQKIEHLKIKTTQPDLRTTTQDWAEYKPFKNELRKLPDSEREAIVDGIAESLSQNAGSSADLSGVFQSKLYYFSKKHALEVMGGKAKPATDLALAVRDGKSIPIVMGSGEIGGGNKSPYEDVLESDMGQFGFNYKVLDPIEMSKNDKVGTKVSRTVSWQHDGQKFTAETQTTLLEPLGKLIPKDKAPNYAALKKDGKLTGMMIIGSNLSSGHASIVDEYVTYYQNQGFEFKPAEKVDAISQFKKSVQSGELDYLIKEAHSDGDEKNLFRANTSGKLYTGTMTKPDGVKEVIYLMAPDEQDTKSKLISNQEFGSWIRDRKKDQPLFYLNASCNSARKVISEVSAAHSENFLPIPSESSVRVFTDSERSGERQILQSFREGKDYAEMRASLDSSGNHQKGEDKFVFPNEERYDKVIRDNLKMNLDVEVKVKDSSGKEIHMDENVDH